MGAVKREMLSGKKQEASYNRFFVNAFTQQDLDDLVEEGGASNKENFKELSKENVKEKGYWDAMFNNDFVGRDGVKRKSKYNRLGDAIFDKYIKSLDSGKVKFIEYERQGKEKKFFIVRKTVSKGERLEFGGKIFKGGMFLPKDFKLGK